ncbi:MAG: retroviral-like aspartic protease family protein [Pseudomonadota bacterium]
MKRLITACVSASLLVAHNAASAADFGTTVPMHEGSKSSYYIDGHLEGYGAVELMVDTGSSYLTINQETLDVLTRKGNAEYSRDLKGSLANGNTIVVPVYKISGLNIGATCRLTEVEAAVFPNASRLILGLNALRQTAPFIFSVDPPSLTLSNCNKT